MADHAQPTDWAEQLAHVSARPHGNESSLRHALYTVLYPYVTTVVGLSDSDIHHEGTGASGRYDSLFGRMLVEYKSPGELDGLAKRRTHARQAINYLNDEGIGADIVVLTDGLTWGILRDSAGPDPGEQAWLEFDAPVPVSDDELFQWRPNSPGTARRILDLLDTVRNVPVSVQSLVNHLGPTRPEVRSLLSELSSALAESTPDSRVDILYRQWLQLAGVSYGIDGPNTPWPNNSEDVLGDLRATLPEVRYPAAIFTLHTYVALCAKMIAAESLSLAHGLQDSRPSQWMSLSNSNFNKHWRYLESGALAENLGASGLMGSDLFGWYTSILSDRPRLHKALRSTLSAFTELGWARLVHVSAITGDLLREFYASVVPRQLRRALGEFFTPQWIADRIVYQSISLLSNGQPNTPLKILDPSCGSGTFLVTAFRRALQAAAQRGLDVVEQAYEAIESVYGFDINPVSAIMSRVNLLLALGDRVSDLGTVSFHVYQADSILIPEEYSGALTFDEAATEMRVPLVIGNIMLPSSLATLRAVSALARVVDQSLERNRNTDTFAKRLRAELKSVGVDDSEIADALNSASVIYERLKEMHESGRNGIWAHVIEQAFAPRAIRDIDLVVGNPPWISWKHLPEAWQQRSEPAWRQWGLWQTKKQGRGIPMSDISTLLLARSVATYCPRGLVALLVPDGILVNEPGGRPIRRSVLQEPGLSASPDKPLPRQPFRTLHVDDFSTLKPFADAANRPIAIYIKPGDEPAFPFPVTEWTRAKQRSTLPTDFTWREVRGRLAATEQSFAPLAQDDIGSRWRRVATTGDIELRARNSRIDYSWGQGFHTRGGDGIFYCEVLSQKPLPHGLVRIRTRPDLGKATKETIDSEIIEIEAQFLWPLIRGQNVKPFDIETSGLWCIVPHKPEKLNEIMPSDDLIKRAPRLYDYLEKHNDLLLARSAYDMELTEDKPWGIQGTSWKHLRSDVPLVVARYMHPKKSPPASVCRSAFREELGRATTAYPNNKLNFVACESLQEADYLAAFVNSAPVQRAIARQCSSTTIAPTTMNALPIPKFDKNDADHRVLAQIGEQCRTDPSQWSDLQNDASKVVTRVTG